MQVLKALQKNDLKTVAHFVGPHGLRFSGAVYAQKTDLKFSRSRLPFLAFSAKKWNWGTYDGSGEPVFLTWAAYRQHFVWKRDFTRVNDAHFGVAETRGTTINNLTDFYAHATLIEYYLPSTSENQMDWTSLWLIWQKSGARWHLIGIVHNEWTT